MIDSTGDELERMNPEQSREDLVLNEQPGSPIVAKFGVCGAGIMSDVRSAGWQSRLQGGLFSTYTE